MIDFLTFRTFISGDILIVIYLFGAFILPFMVWYMVKKISSKIKLFQETRDNIKRVVWSLLSTKQRIGLSLLYVFILLFIEMIWRMMFEFLIAYMQIRDALVL